MPAPLSVATWNLGWRFGGWEARQEPIALTLEAIDADIVCLQETWGDSASGENQAAQLATRLGLHHVAGETASHNAVSFMNAVLTRWPIVDSGNIVLPNAAAKPGHRRALHVVLDSPRGQLHVVTTHLDHRFDGSATRAAQLSVICEHIASIDRNPSTDFPVLLCGDFNAVPDSDEIRTLTGRKPPLVDGQVFSDAWEIAGDGSPGYTWRADNPLLHLAQWPNRRLDYIFASWPRTSGQGTPIACRLFGLHPVDEVMPTDHAGVQAILR